MTDFSDVIWPYGPDKYKGRRMSEIPSGFLKWIAENSFKDDLAEAASDEWHFRDRFNDHFWEDN